MLDKIMQDPGKLMLILLPKLSEIRKEKIHGLIVGNNEKESGT